MKGSTMYCADPSFGLGAQALAILQLLSHEEPEFAEWDEDLLRYRILIGTFPWYNTLERGVVLQVEAPDSREVLCIAFGEERVADNVFVEHWRMFSSAPNGPTAESREGQTLVRNEFPSRKYDEVVKYIFEVMTAYYESRHPDNVVWGKFTK